MTPPEEHHRYREQIGAFVLGKLDGGERTGMQAHLNSCPLCQAEVSPRRREAWGSAADTCSTWETP